MRFVGVDYSGAGRPDQRLPGLQAYVARGGDRPRRVGPDRRGVRNWTRRELGAWLIRLLSDGEPTLVGIDHGFGFPASYLERHALVGWDAFLDDFAEAWPTGQKSVAEVRACDPDRSGSADELRLTERWTSSAKSVFRFDVQGSVASSTHAGLPWLRALRRSVDAHFWPFDGWRPPAGRSVVAEVYPSLFSSRYPREGRTPDEQDAYAVARWLSEMHEREELPRFLQPPLSVDERRLAEREGWILGVC